MEPNNVLTKLLVEVGKVHLQEEQKRLDFKIQGKYFNVFDVLQLSRNEVRLHSAFIAELLNPLGSHGLGDKFLKAFVETIFGYRDQKFSSNNFIKEFDTKSATVETEHYIGSISKKGDEGGRIDILIKDAKNNAIIIENKIDACDQPNQLIRYRDYAEEKLRNYKLLYLTKYGSAASEDSAGKDAQYYIPISYRQDIFGWLNKCISISAMIPTVRETIYQYIINLKEILNIMDEENGNKILNIATDEKYLNATLDIINNKDEIKAQIRRNFMQELDKEARKYGLELDKNGGEFEKIVYLNESYIYFLDKKSKYNKWVFCIGCDKYKHNKSRELFYGISTYNRDDENNITCEHQVYEEKPEHCWPLGYSYIHGSDDLSNWEVNKVKIIDKLTTEFRDTEEHIKEVEAEEKKCIP
ncbi:MAG: PD-(D/E)XK nuclease family protein [Prevotella sp.]|jgi:hypothetical protein|nr:PD-(D/E)XK nuclease family protein [Prevotella sp.]MCH4240444.1 PD-(D/E)XK nuclease family protein [Prevotella sp.]